MREYADSRVRAGYLHPVIFFYSFFYRFAQDWVQAHAFKATDIRNAHNMGFGYKFSKVSALVYLMFKWHCRAGF